MQKSEYRNMFNHEETHFIYTATHHIVSSTLNRFLGKSKSNKILDAGCGTGMLMKRISTFGDITGIDISSDAIKYCKKRGLKNVKVKSVTDTGFRSNSFDAIICIDVLYHKMVDDKKALKEFNRLLKPGGILILKIPSHEWLKSSHDEIAHTRHRYSKGEISKLLTEEKFITLKLSYIFCSLLPFVIVKRFIDKIRNKKSTSDVYKLPTFLNTIFQLTALFENLIMYKINIPNGLSIFAIAKKSNRAGK